LVPRVFGIKKSDSYWDAKVRESKVLEKERAFFIAKTSPVSSHKPWFGEDFYQASVISASNDG
jgi:hypothetical protein